MRYRQGKTSIIIDHVDNVSVHGLPDTKRHWSLEKKKKKANSQAQIEVKQCVDCFMSLPTNTKTCPECGHEFETEATDYQREEQAELQQITKDEMDITLDFREPSDCKNMAELIELGENRGYKKPRGWAYHQAKIIGLVN